MKYRRRHANEITPSIHGSMELEIIWSVVPFLIMMVMFFWGAKLYFEYFNPPPDAMDVYITGKQWMWKVQYPEGQREINELHVPVGRAVKLTMASEDVIHSFFMPAFRLKRDVVPGHFNIAWFTRHQAGTISLVLRRILRNAAQRHDRLGDRDGADANMRTGSPAAESRDRWRRRARSYSSNWAAAPATYWISRGGARSCGNVYGNPVRLDDGRTVIADDAYVRESILNPNAKIVAGFKHDIMPTFQGQVSEEGLMQLIAYIKSLSKPPETTVALPTGASVDPRAGGATDGLAGTRPHSRQNPNSRERNEHSRRNSAAAAEELFECRLRLEVVAVHHGPQADRGPVSDLDHVCSSSLADSSPS